MPFHIRYRGTPPIGSPVTVVRINRATGSVVGIQQMDPGSPVPADTVEYKHRRVPPWAFAMLFREGRKLYQVTSVLDTMTLDIDDDLSPPPP